MKKCMSLFVALALLMGCLALCTFAHAETAEDYRGIWVADDVAVEIWLEDGELHSWVVFTESDENSTIWDYHSCWYNETDACLECAGATRTTEHYDWLTESVEELDWSLGDLCVASFKLSEGGLVFADEEFERKAWPSWAGGRQNPQNCEWRTTAVAICSPLPCPSTLTPRIDGRTPASTIQTAMT